MTTNPLRIDPTRTATLRRRFSTDMSKRFMRLKGAVLKLIVKEDAFGLKRKRRDSVFNAWGLLTLTNNQRFQFQSNEQKLEEFQKWLSVEMDSTIVPKNATGDIWLKKYIDEGYAKGAGRAFDDVKKPALQGNLDFFDGTKDEFLRQSFAHPIAIDKLKLLTSRTLTDLKNVDAAMATQMSRILADGLVQGLSPRDVARRMNKQAIDGIGKVRALTIARTETIRAHAEGQLDALEKLGVSKIGVAVEWSTTGDDRVCPVCLPLEGVVMSIKEARGILPRHPNCRCAFVPANVGESTKGQKRSQDSVAKARNDSIRKEVSGKRAKSLADKKRLSSWPGADTKFGTKRPKSILGKIVPPTPPKKVTKKVVKKKVTKKAVKKKAVKKKAVDPTLGEPFVKPPTEVLPLPKDALHGPNKIKEGSIEQRLANNPELNRLLDEIDQVAAVHEAELLKLGVLDKIQTDAYFKYNDLRDEWLQALDTHKKIVAELEELIDLQRAQGFDVKELVARRDQLTKPSGIPSAREWHKLKDEYEMHNANYHLHLRKAKEKQRDAAHKLLELPDAERMRVVNTLSKKSIDIDDLGEPVHTTVKNHNPEFKSKIKSAEKWIESKMRSRPHEGTEVMGMTAHQLRANKRAFHRSQTKTPATDAGNRHSGVFLTAKNNESVYIHEMIHEVEDIAKDAKKATKEFREMRIAKAGTQDEQLKAVFPQSGYKLDEYGNKDGFGHLYREGSSSPYYVGKTYPGGNTEILTMGIELIFDDPVSFAKKDPEFFKFVVGVLRDLI